MTHHCNLIPEGKIADDGVHNRKKCVDRESWEFKILFTQRSSDLRKN